LDMYAQIKPQVRQPLKCDSPGCDNEVWLHAGRPQHEYHFCKRCKQRHSYQALTIQVRHEKNIEDVILEARLFKTACHMADYIGVSFVTMYHWVGKYFGMSFQEFRRKYICKSEDCYLLNITQSSYSRHDYILKKIRDKRYCACVNALGDCIMTNTPIPIISAILTGCPPIVKVSDDMFALRPSPFHFTDYVQPVYGILEVA